MASFRSAGSRGIAGFFFATAFFATAFLATVFFATAFFATFFTAFFAGDLLMQLLQRAVQPVGCNVRLDRVRYKA
ncbi:MAG: hypothetical protein FJW21_08890 [Acidimicrobiia bacterium]|nr:hypothetical protein [Acidimicrobiia bacterium]